MGSCAQFGLLIWKNFLLQKRRPIATIFELLIPIFFAALLVVIRTQIDVTRYPNVTTWRDFKIDNLPQFPPDLVPNDLIWNIGYAPNNVQEIRKVLVRAETRLNQIAKTRLETKCNFDAKQFVRLSSGFGSSSSLSPNATRRLQACILGDLSAEQRRQYANITAGFPPTYAFRSLALFLKIIPKIRLIGFDSEEKLLEYAKNDTNLKSMLAGVIFNGTFGGGGLPDDLTLTFRFHAEPLVAGRGSSSAFTGITNSWKTHLLFPGFEMPEPRTKNSISGGNPNYYSEGFLSVMHAINMGLADFATGTNLSLPSFRVQRYPYPPYTADEFLIAIQRTLPMLIMLSFFYTSLVIVRSVVQEKESKMKEYMMMMGLSSWLHWLAWFIKYLIFLCISCVFICILYKVQTSKGSVLTYSDPILIFLFLVTFSAATINLCFLFSVFFSKANVAAVAGGTLYGLTYMPYLFTQNSFDTMSHAAKLLSCLSANVAMANGFQLIGNFEGQGVGAQWRNIHKGVTVDDTFSLLEVMIMLIGDAVLYMLLAAYIEGVRPGDYGVPKPWYFPFTTSFWCGNSPASSKRKRTGVEGIDNPNYEPLDPGDDNEFFEEEPKDLRRVVEIKGLRKVFKSNGKTNVAVNFLNLNMYDNQITVLLGHNGAGKTTTMSMLTGFFPPTRGDAVIDGHSICDDIRGVRKSLGLCPQFNILFDLLTVDEHLYFFGRLKGLSSGAAKKECKHMKTVLKLEDKGNAKSKTLSGGMKRKLSVGIALSAGSKYVILDEPTSGMDPSARRAIWEVLQHYRSHCSMLLSTHFMDEADLLGDRIAIMSNGNLRCVGSSVFLKNKFGVGYHIVLTKADRCNVVKLTELFQSFVPETHLERAAGAELSFVLPFRASPQFPRLFDTLEARSKELGISGFGAVVTTMEEVFLRVTEGGDRTMRSISQKLAASLTKVARRSSMNQSSLHAETDHRHNLQSINAPKEYLHTSRTLNTGCILWFQQFYALVVKRMLHSMRNYKVAIAQILIPVCFSIVAIMNAKYPPFVLQNLPLNLTLEAYGPNDVYVTNNVSGYFASNYTEQFKGTLTTARVINGNLQDFLTQQFAEIGGEFNAQNLVSASFAKDVNRSTTKATAWFNAQAYHTAATSLAYLDQAYLRMVTGGDVSISFINFPLPRNTSNRVQEQLVGSLTGFLISFNIVLGFSFLAASFCIFLVRERVDRSALLQTLAGVDPFCFWLSAFVWDFVNFITPAFLTLVMFACFSIDEFTRHTGEVLLLFALYCWASLPLIYMLSFLFSVPSTALVRVTMLNIITGLASVITINILRILSLKELADGLNWAFLLMPPFSLGQGLGDIYTNDKMVEVCTTSSLMEILCKQQGINFQTNFLAWEELGIGKFVVFLAGEGLIFFALLFFIEYGIPKKMFMIIKQILTLNMVYVTTDDFDDDVTAERERINKTELPRLVTSDRLIIKNLKKVYGSGASKIVAVDELCLGVPEGECFGLLGINGAGKTTTFKMLTGDHDPTSGTAYFDGYDIRRNQRKAQQRMGYCPQFDALIEQMTGSETLRMFARLRGVPESEIPACIKNLSEILHFDQHLEKSCGTYSGGNKRKLSTAIALVGNPPVVLLDEPSTGMDPGARRMLWDALTSVRASGRSIIITSHSMEECEALCTRLAIMVNGTFRCIGGPQHLKTKFGQGYTVEVMTSDTCVKDHLASNFPAMVLKGQQQGLLSYHIPQFNNDSSEMKLAAVFGHMERAKSAINFKDYTVTQTTLEQVFLSLVRWQRESSNDAA